MINTRTSFLCVIVATIGWFKWKHICTSHSTKFNAIYDCYCHKFKEKLMLQNLISSKSQCNTTQTPVKLELLRWASCIKKHMQSSYKGPKKIVNLFELDPSDMEQRNVLYKFILYTLTHILTSILYLYVISSPTYAHTYS